MNGEFILRYRTCTTHEEVMEMQELIQKEIADERIRRKAEQGEWFHDLMTVWLNVVADYDEGDLLKANPNHKGDGWDDDDTDSAEEDSEAEANENRLEADDAETLSRGMQQTIIK